MDMELEYKCPADGAWYAVTLDYGQPTEGAAYFKICYKVVIPEGEVEVVDLSDTQKVQEVRRNFRRVSLQLQDSKCHTVEEGTQICVSYEKVNDRRFYDAILRKVQPMSDHRNKEGSICDCIFEVKWANDEIEKLDIGRICLLTPGGVDDHPGIQFLQNFLVAER